MPWEVIRSRSCPDSRPWAVVNQVTRRVVACHPTKKGAQKQMSALYANVPESRPQS